MSNQSFIKSSGRFLKSLNLFGKNKSRSKSLLGGRYRSSITLGLYIVLFSLIVLFFICSFSPGFRIGKYRVAHLEVGAGDNKRVFEGEVVDGMTILEAMNVSALAGNITFKYTIDGIDNKLKIHTLNGYLSNQEDEVIDVYLNSSKVDLGQIHMITIKPGDIISIKVEKW